MAEVEGQFARAVIGCAGIQIREGGREPPHVCGIRRGQDVDVERRARIPVDDHGEAADHEELHLVARKRR